MHGCRKLGRRGTGGGEQQLDRLTTQGHRRADRAGWGGNELAQLEDPCMQLGCRAIARQPIASALTPSSADPHRRLLANMPSNISSAWTASAVASGSNARGRTYFLVQRTRDFDRVSLRPSQVSALTERPPHVRYVRTGRPPASRRPAVYGWRVARQHRSRPLICSRPTNLT